MYNTNSIKEILNYTEEKTGLTVYGWIRTKRESKTFSFIELNDGSTIQNLQIIINDTVPGYSDTISTLTTGASVEVVGNLVASQGGKQKFEIQAQSVKVLGVASPDEYPLQKKKHTLEYLREIGHLRPRTNTIAAVLRVRNAACFAIHTFFQERGFNYIQTPVITASDCEGAGQMFQVTTLELEKIPFIKDSNGKTTNEIDYSKDFFGKKAGLTVSGQLEGEIMATALGKIYTFGPTFRAEHSNTTRHLAEFWMIEPEMAFCDIFGNMDLAEKFVKSIVSYVMKECKDDLDFFTQYISPDLMSNLAVVIENKFERITYTDAVDILLKSGVKFEYPVQWGIDLQSEHEKYITEVVYKKPVIVTGYPKEIKAFYMKLNDDGKTVRAMDILVPRLGEIIGGSEREDNYEKLCARIKECGLNEEDYWWYLELRKFGSVPHAGFGLGFERLIQFITGMQNIRDVIAFPRAFKTAEF
ncbi:MAG: asparagine--tRNA ligase [Spirochaetes bacterium GWF1_31_7]|nr:MAG: asparagine--tRNA ligase [Spirochaetes bacterium GWE1_32_154]OHD47820.1 MAG: asparagine--tRNA ligase [Spirochaetes bacterium GWE2_31_10]OHD52548.1 MAG: asparagine--tRNA ligase [Spirochaetes bacterium GWF1_31_7]OHD80751.1 MAG: asparagine--tRNA ligase [Spirochaetes bacterium RIFOXYB1_FULL_32_8]HBD93423.1 asparagine--tRNA ligase [Spirochaetia bacterium]